MFLADDFVYIHVPKTGGTFVSAALRQLYDELARPYVDTMTLEGRTLLQAADQHGTVRDIPTRYHGKPVLFSVRNPFDWYVSLFEFAWWKQYPEVEFDQERVSARFPSFPELTFSEFIEAVNDWRLWPVGDRQLGRFKEEHSIGLLTWQLIVMLSDDPPGVFSALDSFVCRPFESKHFPNLHALNMATLANDLRMFLADIGISGDQTEFISRLGRIYPAEGRRRVRSHWSTYYNHSLRRAIVDAERLVFGRWPEFNLED